MELTMGESRTAEATRACLYGVISWFNTDEPFWGDFVPESDRTWLSDDQFALTLRSGGIFLEVRGVTLECEPGLLQPSLIVGARSESRPSAPVRWHPVSATMDERGCFVTSNFRAAVQASIEDVRAQVT
jgi:hypothetical protein